MTDTMNAPKKTLDLLEGKYGSSKFVRDGIIDKDAWNKAPVKILVILKEPNGEQGNKTPEGDYNLCTELSDVKKLKENNVLSKYATWRNVFYWQNGLLNIASNSPISFEECKALSKNGNLNSLAVLNLKKTYGGASSNMKEIETFGDTDKDLILEQIERIDPDIIITSNVMYILEKILPKEEIVKDLGLGDEYKDWVNQWKRPKKSVCIIRHYHPQATSCKEFESFSDKIKFEKCCDCYKAYLSYENKESKATPV